MTRTLLTGGSGFIAAHVLENLLKSGHSVVTTVRSQAKADKIKEAHPNVKKDQLDFTIVEDIAKEDAFDEAIKSDPPFEAVIHTASPFHFKADDIKKDLIDPAVVGTTGILKAIKKNAPTVKRVVITSSFAAMVNPEKPTWPDHTYSEKDWSPLTMEDALKNQSAGYRGSKTFAEKAAWDFIEEEKPNFTLAVMNPPLVLGPIVHYLNDLNALNTSNQRVRDYIQGKVGDEVPDTGVYCWVDVRDIAQAHVKAMEEPDAANKRFFITQGHLSNKAIIEVIRKNFPDLASNLPPPTAKGGDLPDPIFALDNSRAKKILGLEFRPLDKSIPDLVKSLQAVGA